VIHPGFRIFILGAGFSRPAGLPVATELYPLVQQHIKIAHGAETKFSRDVANYLEYCSDCGVTGQTAQNLDLELFMSYLDIEHYLGFRGSKAWSQEGNESQLMIRRAIGHVINERTPDPKKLPDFYYRFAEQLSVHDTVLTLNYDLVLEHALKEVGKPFRRFPHRYKEIHDGGGILDSSVEELVLLKLHGSLDWFDSRYFLELKESAGKKGVPDHVLHSVLGQPDLYGLSPLVNTDLPTDDDLRYIHQIHHVEKYYSLDKGFNAPFILSPSHIKFVYAKPILGFWHGLGRSGAYNLGVSVIGFSLPSHDEYIRRGLYQMLSNYGSWWDSKVFDNLLKDYMRFVDFRPTQDRQQDYMDRYRFASTDRSRFFFDGFGSEAINFLFNDNRKV
jgi:hypothetical protein